MLPVEHLPELAETMGAGNMVILQTLPHPPTVGQLKLSAVVRWIMVDRDGVLLLQQYADNKHKVGRMILSTLCLALRLHYVTILI